MVQGLVTILAVVVAVSLLPVAILAALFGIVDYFADDEKLDEIRRAGHEGGSPDLTEGTAPGTRPGVEEGSAEWAFDPADVSGTEPAGTDDGVTTVTCPSCGTENSADYRFCGECAGEL